MMSTADDAWVRRHFVAEPADGRDARTIIAQLVATRCPLLDPDERGAAVQRLHASMVGLGPIDAVRDLCLRIMPKSLDLVVPLKVDIKTGKNWGELEVARGPLLSESEAELAFAETPG